MLLYHFNFGYPLLCADSRFICSPSKVQQITGEKDGFSHMGEPVDGAAEKLYLHEPDVGSCRAGLINPRMGLGAYIEFDTKTLPVLIEWKNLCSHDYALGIEPCNCYSKGRVDEKANGTISVIQPYESIPYEVVMGVVENEALRQFEQTIDNI